MPPAADTLGQAADRLLGACRRVRSVTIAQLPAANAGLGAALRICFDPGEDLDVEQLLAQLDAFPGVLPS